MKLNTPKETSKYRQSTHIANTQKTVSLKQRNLVQQKKTKNNKNDIWNKEKKTEQAKWCKIHCSSAN